MFELIGIAVVAWVGFKLVNHLLENAVLDMQARAVVYATMNGVPQSYAVAMSMERDTVKAAMQALSSVEVGFGKLRIHERFGRGIVFLYTSHLKAEEAKNARRLAGLKVERHLAPQIEHLKSEGVRLLVNEVTYAYVGALAGAMTKEVIGTDDIHDIVRYVFRSEHVDELIQNAHMIVQYGPEDLARKMTALVPVVNRELEEGVGSYYVKFTRRARSDKPDGATFDPRQVTLEGYLGLKDESDAGDAAAKKKKPSKKAQATQEDSFFDDDIPF